MPSNAKDGETKSNAEDSGKVSTANDDEKVMPPQDSMESRLKAVQMTGGKLLFPDRWEIYQKTSCNAQCRERHRDHLGKTLSIAGPPDKLKEAEQMALDILVKQEGVRVKEENKEDARKKNHDKEENKEDARKQHRHNRPCQHGHGRGYQNQQQPGNYGYPMQTQQPGNYGYPVQPPPGSQGYPLHSMAVQGYPHDYHYQHEAGYNPNWPAGYHSNTHMHYQPMAAYQPQAGYQQQAFHQAPQGEQATAPPGIDADQNQVAKKAKKDIVGELVEEKLKTAMENMKGEMIKLIGNANQQDASGRIPRPPQTEPPVTQTARVKEEARATSSRRVTVPQKDNARTDSRDGDAENAIKVKKEKEKEVSRHEPTLYAPPVPSAEGTGKMHVKGHDAHSRQGRSSEKEIPKDKDIEDGPIKKRHHRRHGHRTTKVAPKFDDADL
jgi:hypothetical protein